MNIQNTAIKCIYKKHLYRYTYLFTIFLTILCATAHSSNSSAALPIALEYTSASCLLLYSANSSNFYNNKIIHMYSVLGNMDIKNKEIKKELQ